MGSVRRFILADSLLFRRLPRGQRKSILRRLCPRSVLLSSSAVFSHEVKMFAIATVALLVVSVTVQAAKYDYGGHDSYKYEDHGSYEPKTYDYGHKSQTTYRHKRSAREGLELCLEICDIFDRNCIEECKLAAEEEVTEVVNNKYARDSMQFPSCIGLCKTNGPRGPHIPCRSQSRATGLLKHFCYVSEPCKDAIRSVLHQAFLFSTDACCGDRPCV